MLQSMGLQRVRHDLATEQQQNVDESFLRNDVFYNFNVSDTIQKRREEKFYPDSGTI